MLLLNVHGVVLGLRDVCFHATLDCAWRCLRTSWCVRFHVTLDCAWRCLRTSWCALSCCSYLYMALSHDFVICALSCYSWLCMALSQDLVICAIMLLLTVHGVVSRLRDMCFHVTLDSTWHCLKTSWYVLSCYSWLCMALTHDLVMCAIMLLLTVHGDVSWLRDMCYHVTLDCAWRCLRTSW